MQTGISIYSFLKKRFSKKKFTKIKEKFKSSGQRNSGRIKGWTRKSIYNSRKIEKEEDFLEGRLLNKRINQKKEDLCLEEILLRFISLEQLLWFTQLFCISVPSSSYQPINIFRFFQTKTNSTYVGDLSSDIRDNPWKQAGKNAEL